MDKTTVFLWLIQTKHHNLPHSMEQKEEEMNNGSRK